MRLIDPHFRREDPVLHQERMAATIAQDPRCLQIALDNLDRWERWGRWGRTHPGPIKQWREMILHAWASPAGLDRLLDFLRTAHPDHEPLLSCSPLVGFPMPPAA
jgi:hypothetical protein